MICHFTLHTDREHGHIVLLDCDSFRWSRIVSNEKTLLRCDHFHF